MYSLRRSCQAAVHSAPPAVNVFAAARGAHRAFSRTSACSRGALPVFLESSTPELSALLAEYNAKILLPTHLTSEQQKLVFSKAGKTKIEAEPVEITLGEVTLPLQHLDRNKLPDRFAQLRAILRTSKTSQDHENVVRLIEGIEDSKIVFKPQWKELIVRTLNRRRMHHLVLKALQRPEATGLRLTEWPLVREVFGGLHRKAAFAAVDDQAEQTAQAYRFATQIVELMENEAHHGPSIMKDGRLVQRDWRSDPAVIAVPTELAAMLAKKHGMDVAAVKKLSSRLINALKQTDYMARLDTVAQSTEALPSQFKNKVVQVSTQIRLAHDTEPIIWVWNALKLSRNVLGAEMPLAEEARQFEERAAQVIFAALKAMEPLNLRKGSNVVPRFAQDIAELVKQCES